MAGMSSGRKPPAPIRYDALNVSSSMMDLPVPIFWGQRRLGTNAIDYCNFEQHSSNAKGKGGGAKGQKIYDYTAATVLALAEGPIDSIARAWAEGSTTTTSSLGQLNMTFFNGSASQAPWSWMASNFPSRARAYAYTAYLACPKQDLGESATIPDNAFECVRSNGFAYTHTTQGWINPSTHTQFTAIDVLLSDCITDLLCNTQYGVLFSLADIGDTTQYATYMRAQGLFFSPLLSQLEKATSILNRWAQLSNSWIYWSGTQLQFVPLGDSQITGNGVTYTPNDDVAYNLGPNDFLPDDGDAPVKVSRLDPADCPNRTIVNITDRTIGYTSNPLEYKDQTLCDTYGLRDNENVQADEICDPPVGKIVAQLIGKRAAYIRNSYAFKVSHRYVLCLPGTILTLTEPSLGLNQVRVRVKTIKRDSDHRLAFECEEFPGNIGTYVAPGASIAGNVTTYPNEYADPGPVNTPAVVEPNSSFSQVPKLLIAASGGANWGGCQVNISFDGANYSFIGRITAPAPQGKLTSALLNHPDPDTVDGFYVDCSESLTVPTAVTPEDADALRSLAFLVPQPTISGGVASFGPGELVAFGDVTASGTYAANITYLRRGVYGTSPELHLIGSQFTVLDTLGQTGSTLAYELPPQYVNKPVYLKLASFNVFGNALEDLSVVQEYTYTPSGAGYGTAPAGAPAQPTGLVCNGYMGGANVAWNANPVADNVTYYVLWRAAGADAPFSSAIPVWRGGATNIPDASIAASGSYTYYVQAENDIGSSIPSAAAWCAVQLPGQLAAQNLVEAADVAAGVLLGNAIRLKVWANPAETLTAGTYTGEVTINADAVPLYDINGHMVVAQNVVDEHAFLVRNGNYGVGNYDSAATVSSIGAYGWGYVWLISNGPGGALGVVVSASSTLAGVAMPAGWSYGFRVGAVKLYAPGSASVNDVLFPSVQYGRVAQYINLGVGYVPPLLANGQTPGFNLTAQTARGNVAPPTATHMQGQLYCPGGYAAYAAPNPNYGTTESNPPYVSASFNNVTAPVTVRFEIMFESDQVYYGSSSTGAAFYCTGWSDNVAA